MSQGPLCPNLTQKVQEEVCQMANRNLLHTMQSGGLSVILNYPKTCVFQQRYDAGFEPHTSCLAVRCANHLAQGPLGDFSG